MPKTDISALLKEMNTSKVKEVRAELNKLKKEAIDPAPKPLTRLRLFIPLLGKGGAKGILDACDKHKVMASTFSYNPKPQKDKDTLETLKKSDIVLIAGNLPIPVGMRQQAGQNYCSRIMRLANRHKKLIYFIGEPQEVLHGNRTGSSLGVALRNATPHHVKNRFDNGLERVKLIEKRGYANVFIAVNNPTSEEMVKITYRRAFNFFDQLLSSFRHT